MTVVSTPEQTVLETELAFATIEVSPKNFLRVRSSYNIELMIES